MHSLQDIASGINATAIAEAALIAATWVSALPVLPSGPTSPPLPSLHCRLIHSQSAHPVYQSVLDPGTYRSLAQATAEALVPCLAADNPGLYCSLAQQFSVPVSPITREQQGCPRGPHGVLGPTPRPPCHPTRAVREHGLRHHGAPDRPQRQVGRGPVRLELPGEPGRGGGRRRRVHALCRIQAGVRQWQGLPQLAGLARQLRRQLGLLRVERQPDPAVPHLQHQRAPKVHPGLTRE